MVRADLLDAIDVRLREIRGNESPFGGVQIVMVGDFMQLPPVVRDKDRHILEQLGYDTPFAFSARVFSKLSVTRVTLDRVFRQEEQEFIELLGRIRSGKNLTESIQLINERCVGGHRGNTVPLVLTATVAAAERYNRDGLAAL